MRPLGECGDVAEWSKALAWKVSIRQKRIEGSNPSVSAIAPSCETNCLPRPWSMDADLPKPLEFLQLWTE